MPAAKQPHRSRNRRKLQQGKKDFMRLQIPKEPLGRLRRPKHRPQVHQHRRDGKHARKHAQPFPHNRASRPHQKHTRHHNIHTHGKHLKRHPAEQDIIRRRRVLVIRRLDANQRRARHLGNGRYDIRRNKEPQNHPRRDERKLPAQAGNQHRKNGIYTRGEEHGRGDDEKVVEHEINEVVGVLVGGERARDVADNLKDEADGKRAEPPGAVPVGLVGVQRQPEGEPGGGKGGEGEGRGEAVDDDGDVIFAVGVGEVGVDVAACAVWVVLVGL